MDDIFNTIFSIVEIDKISSKKDFDAFIDNLIDHPTPVREACAYKIDEAYRDEYLDENVLDIILKAVTDINPNVSRCICSLIKNHIILQEKLCPKLILKIKNVLKQIPECESIQNNKNHAKNKLLFSLYWLMEALFYSFNKSFSNEIVNIISCTIRFCDYTIREKSAQLLTKIENPPYDLIECIKIDKNFYVNFYSKFI